MSTIRYFTPQPFDNKTERKGVRSDSAGKFNIPAGEGKITLIISMVGYEAVEAGFAIANIFKFLRVDAIKRFSYLDHPGIPKYGIRFQLKFDY